MYLPEIELCVLLGRDTLDLDEGGVGTGVTLSSFVSENATFAVESVRTTVS